MALCEDVPNRARCLRQHLKNQSWDKASVQMCCLGVAIPGRGKWRKREKEAGKDGNQLKVTCDCFTMAYVRTHSSSSNKQNHHQLVVQQEYLLSHAGCFGADMTEKPWLGLSLGGRWDRIYPPSPTSVVKVEPHGESAFLYDLLIRPPWKPLKRSEFRPMIWDVIQSYKYAERSK